MVCIDRAKRISRAALDRDRVLWYCAAAASYFLLYYLSDPNLPGIGGAAVPGNPLSGWFGSTARSGVSAGWWAFYDQSQYLRLAHALARLDFDRLLPVYTYGIGYPLVAVPAMWLGITKDPFVFFDLFAFVFATYAVCRAAGKLISPVAGLFAGFGLVLATPLIQYVDQPWNSTVCLVVMSFLLVTLTRDVITRSRALAVGLMLGWAFAARFVDVLWLGVIAVGCVYRGSTSDVVKRLVPPALIGALVFILPVLYLQYKALDRPPDTLLPAPACCGIWK